MQDRPSFIKMLHDKKSKVDEMIRVWQSGNIAKFITEIQKIDPISKSEILERIMKNDNNSVVNQHTFVALFKICLKLLEEKHEVIIKRSMDSMLKLVDKFFKEIIEIKS